MFLLFLRSLFKCSRQPTTLPFDDQSSLCFCSCLFNTLVKSLDIQISLQWRTTSFNPFIRSFAFWYPTSHILPHCVSSQNITLYFLSTAIPSPPNHISQTQTHQSPLISFHSISSPYLLSATNTISTIFLTILHIHKFIHVFTQHTHALRLIIRPQHQLARCASLTKHKSTEITNTRLMKTVEFFTTQIATVPINPLFVIVSRLLQHSEPRDRENHVLLRVTERDRSLRGDAGWGLHLLRRRFVALCSIHWWFLFRLERKRGFAGSREDDYKYSCSAERAAIVQSFLKK